MRKTSLINLFAEKAALDFQAKVEDLIEQKEANDLVEKQTNDQDSNQSIQEQYSNYVLQSQYSYEADFETQRGAHFVQSLDSSKSYQEGKIF